MWRALWQGKAWRDRFSYAWHDVFAIYLTNIPFIFLALFSTLLALGQFRKLFILFMSITLLPVIFSQVFLSRLSRLADISSKLQFFRKVFLHPAYPFYHLNHIAMNSSTKFVLGAIVGAVVGVQIGILIAPDKGSNTRKKITKKGGEYLDDFTGKINGLLDNLTRKVTEQAAKGEEASRLRSGGYWIG